MGRSCLIWIFLFGFFASAMTTCASRMHRSDSQIEMSRDGAGRSFTTDSGSSRGSSSYSDGSQVEIQRDSNGHFYADVEINGAPIHMLIDTGATGIALSREDARSAGVATSIGMSDVVGQGADGSVHGEFVRLDRVRLGGTEANGLDAIVLNSGEQSLLGQEFLSKFDSVEIHGDTMVLK
jgi:aspartyl protease family protein